MKKILEIDLVSVDSLFEKYNRRQISKELIDYMVNEADLLLREKVDLKIIINNQVKNDSDIIKIIKQKLLDEYDKTILKHQNNIIKQLIYFLIGITALFFSTLIQDTIFKEIVLIGGWVLIWYMVELELFSDMELRKRRRVIKRLLESEIKVK